MTAITTAMMPIGTFTKKIHRQDRPEVRMPPSSGPIATARPVTAPQTPNATPRSLPRKASASSASDTANMIAPPTPCKARDSWSISVLTAKPHSTDAQVKTTSPTMYTRRQQERRQRQGVGINDPLQVGETRLQRLLDIRQGDVHDRDVQQQHEGAEAHRDQRPPFVTALAGICAASAGLLALGGLTRPGQICVGFGHEGSRLTWGQVHVSEPASWTIISDAEVRQPIAPKSDALCRRVRDNVT